MRLIDSTAIPVVTNCAGAASINIPPSGLTMTVDKATANMGRAFTYSYTTPDTWRKEYEELHEEFLNLKKLLRSYGISGFSCSEERVDDSAHDPCIDEDLLDTMYMEDVEE